MLAGARAGRATLGGCSTWSTRAPSKSNHCYVEGVEVATASYLRESVVEFRDAVRRLRSIGVEMVTTPNFSLFVDGPRWDDLHSIKRIPNTHAGHGLSRPASASRSGRVAVWDGCLPDVTHQNHVIRFRADGSLSPRFALYFMMSPAGRRRITAQASSTSGLHTLSISKVAGLPVPLCSLEEQSEVVRILDSRLDAAESMEAEIDAELARAEALRQSILKRAFSGKLVP